MVVAYVLLVLSVLVGGGSLLAFGLFLAFGPFETVPLGLEPWAALAWDAGLCLVFFIQHSGMVRASFREWLSRWLPRYTLQAVYSVASGTALLLLVGLWQQTPLLLAVEGVPRWALRGLFVGAGFVFLWAVRSLGAFDTFGLGPIKAHLRGTEASGLPFAARGPYRWVRHPLYALFLVLLWTCPDVTAGRLLFNTAFTVWITVGAWLEERDLVRAFGEPYRAYQRAVPMLVPWRVPDSRSIPNGVDS
jgi:protein-S-isoprenylcysteine O-methyltransferase Ste14